MIESSPARVEGEITLKRADFSHVVFLWYLRNCPEVYKHYRAAFPISWDEHVMWLTPVLLGTVPTVLYIVEQNGVMVGNVRFDVLEDESAKVNLALMKEWWGKGIGTQAIKAAMAKLGQEEGIRTVVSEVHEDNISSLRLTQKSGLLQYATEGPWKLFRISLDDSSADETSTSCEPENLYEMLERQAMANPSKLALIGDATYTYQELFFSTLRVSNRLREVPGVSPGECVAIVLPNVCAYAPVVFSLNKIGAIGIPVNIRLDNETVGFILSESKAEVIITDREHREKFADVFGARTVLTIEDHPDWFAPGKLEDEAMKIEKEKVCPMRNSDTAIVIFTSGTTGTPKGAMMTNANLLFNCRSCDACFGLDSSDRHLIVVPLFHVTGLNSQLLASIYKGSTAVVLEKYHTEDVMEFLERYDVTFFIAVPSVFILLLSKFRDRFAELEHLKKVGYAGAPMPVATVQALKETIPGIQCYNFYGLTETSSITTVLPDRYALETPDSVGVGAPGVSLKVVSGRGEEISRGDVGELLIKGGNIVKGYINNEVKTCEAIAGGWLHSGDLVSIDELGRVFLKGRIKEMINRGGEKIFPIVLENRLYNHPKILDSAVVGMPHKIFGEVVCAFIVSSPGAHLTEADVIAYCKETCADYEVPERVVFLEELPRNANGKVQKLVLKQQLQGV